MKEITDKLFELQDKKYRELQLKIIPNINYKSFLEELPYKYFDENHFKKILDELHPLE